MTSGSVYPILLNSHAIGAKHRKISIHVPLGTMADDIISYLVWSRREPVWFLGQ